MEEEEIIAIAESEITDDQAQRMRAESSFSRTKLLLKKDDRAALDPENYRLPTSSSGFFSGNSDEIGMDSSSVDWALDDSMRDSYDRSSSKDFNANREGDSSITLREGKDIDEFVFDARYHATRKLLGGGKGGTAQVYLYDVMEPADTKSKVTTFVPITYAVKVFDPMYLSPKSSVKQVSGLKMLLIAWNEWLGLKSVRIDGATRGIAFVSKPPLPAPVRENLTRILRMHNDHRSGAVVDLGKELKILYARLGSLQERLVEVALVMEYFPSEDLWAYTYHRQGKVSYRRVQDIIYQVLKIVGDLHSIDILHNDIKPDNFLYNEVRMLVKICDFGSVGHAQHICDGFAITRSYASPDRYLYPSKMSDVFALGKTIAFLLEMVDWSPFSSAECEQEKQHWQHLVSEMTKLAPESRPCIASILGSSPVYTVYLKNIKHQQIDRRVSAEAVRVDQRYRLPHRVSEGGTMLLTLYEGDKRSSVPNTEEAFYTTEVRGPLVILDDLAFNEPDSKAWGLCCCCCPTAFSPR